MATPVIEVMFGILSLLRVMPENDELCAFGGIAFHYALLVGMSVTFILPTQNDFSHPTDY
jgi:hypothetical protein